MVTRVFLFRIKKRIKTIELPMFIGFSRDDKRKILYLEDIPTSQ
jgi:hypothetical protein